MYEKTREYIFSEIGKRIKANKKKYGFTNYQLAGYKNKADYESHQKDSGFDSKEDKQLRYDKFDYSIITNITNGKSHPNKNPNLLSDIQLEHLTKTLKFSSEMELLWGDFEREDVILERIFKKIIIDILYGEDENLKNIFNEMLFDYVPYAEYHSYWQMFVVVDIDMPKMPDTSFTIPAYWYQLKQDEIFEKYEIKQKNAIEFIYYKFYDDFNKLIKIFLKNEFKIESGYTLKKINKKLKYLVSQLSDFVIDNMPNEDSLGLRVRSIMISDYKRFGILIAREMKGEEMELNELTLKHLVESSLTYITELKRVQVIELEVIKGYKFTVEEEGNE